MPQSLILLASQIIVDRTEKRPLPSRARLWISKSLEGSAAPTAGGIARNVGELLFQVNALLKSKMPTTNTTSNGKATANSTNCAARSSRQRVFRPALQAQTSGSPVLHVHARRRGDQNLLLIQSRERQPELKWIAERDGNATDSVALRGCGGQLDRGLHAEICIARRRRN